MKKFLIAGVVLIGVTALLNAVVNVSVNLKKAQASAVKDVSFGGSMVLLANVSYYVLTSSGDVVMSYVSPLTKGATATAFLDVTETP